VETLFALLRAALARSTIAQSVKVPPDIDADEVAQVFFRSFITLY
jgi:hypothetical protein